VVESFEAAKKDVRMEDPVRMLTRLAFKFVKELMSA